MAVAVMICCCLPAQSGAAQRDVDELQLMTTTELGQLAVESCSAYIRELENAEFRHEMADMWAGGYRKYGKEPPAYTYRMHREADEKERDAEGYPVTIRKIGLVLRDKNWFFYEWMGWNSWVEDLLKAQTNCACLRAGARGGVIDPAIAAKCTR